MTSFANVSGYEGYVVTSDGEVLGPKGFLNKNLSVRRYHQVSLGSRTDKEYVHRLVAQAFVPNPENKPQVAHWDGCGANNRAENLRWVTQSENESDKRRHGRLAEGERHGKSKLTTSDVRRIRSLRESGVHVDEVAHLFGVSRWTIYDACNPRRQWKHVKEVP